MFTWIMQRVSRNQWQQKPCSFILADYNPSVLRLVTLPNFLLAWALQNTHNPVLQDAFNIEGELELSPGIIQAFKQFLSSSGIHISFISGAWSPEFIRCLYDLPAFSSNIPAPTTLMVGAETIYSPFALQAFTQIMFAILSREKASSAKAAAYVAAKRLYFGVGGSLDDFIEEAQSRGATVTALREESEGVRRGVVHCTLQR
jgi:protein-histidine N-methyltransferase